MEICYELVVKLFIEFYSDEVANQLTTLGCVERMKLVREWAERMCMTGVNNKVSNLFIYTHKFQSCSLYVNIFLFFLDRRRQST